MELMLLGPSVSLQSAGYFVAEVISVWERVEDLRFLLNSTTRLKHSSADYNKEVMNRIDLFAACCYSIDMFNYYANL